MNNKIWMNGEFFFSMPTVSLLTHALHYGTSVFEGLRSYNGKIFKCEEHFKRLHQSAELLDFKIPYSIDELVQVTNNLVHSEAENHTDLYIRPLAWCNDNKITVSNNGCAVNVAIMIWPRNSILSEYNSDEIPQSFWKKLNVAKWKKYHPATFPVQSKSAGMYPTAAANKLAAETSGFDDAVVLDHDDYVSEATSSNLFFVDQGTLITPPTTSCLNGITRQTCIEIAKELSIPFCENKIKLNDIAKCSEVFLTGTAVEILPVYSVTSERFNLINQNGNKNNNSEHKTDIFTNAKFKSPIMHKIARHLFKYIYS